MREGWPHERKPGPEALVFGMRQLVHPDILPAELEEAPDFKRDLAALLVVRDVRYRPRWSWEVEQVVEAPLDALPADLSPRVTAWLDAMRPSLD